MSKISPRTREEAFVYQFEDDVKMLKAVSLVSESSFENALTSLEAHISAYRSIRLKKQAQKAIKKTEERQKYMKENYPELI